jgi:ubiquinol-cytochrome c reductase cytochrome b subunit
VVFLVLYLWPWLERFVTKDRRAHQLLERPRDRPGRVAFGVAALSLNVVLLLAWSEDVISRYTQIPVYHLVYAFRIGTVALPLLTGTVAFVLARALRDSEAEGVLSLTAADVRAALRRRRPDDEEDEEAAAEEPAPAPEEPGTEEVERPVEDHLPVEAGPTA